MASSALSRKSGGAVVAVAAAVDDDEQDDEGMTGERESESRESTPGGYLAQTESPERLTSLFP